MKQKSALILLICLAAVSVSCNRKTEISLNEPIKHDDFEYSVTDYVLTRFIRSGNDTLNARGMFYLVNFQVKNKALRVSHKWDNRTACLVDEDGNTYENDPQAAQFYCRSIGTTQQESFSTPAGNTESAILAFDVPFSVTRPCIKVRGYILMGDVFNFGRFRRMKIKLY